MNKSFEGLEVGHEVKEFRLASVGRRSIRDSALDLETDRQQLSALCERCL